MNLSKNRYQGREKRMLRRDFIKLGALATGVLINPLSALAAINPQPNLIKKLSFYNTHTNERLSVCYYRNGEFDVKALSKINYILRDHRSREVKAIDIHLLDMLHTLSLKTKPQATFHVISGYRSPATNRKLRKNGNGVASKSLHMYGKAIDIRMPGYSTRQLRNVARKMKAGGVGYYPKSDFVHIDTGRVRFW